MTRLVDTLVSDNSAVTVRVDHEDVYMPVALLIGGPSVEWWLDRDDVVTLITLLVSALAEVPQ